MFFFFKKGPSKIKSVGKLWIKKFMKERRRLVYAKSFLIFPTSYFKKDCWSLKQWVYLLKTKKAYTIYNFGVQHSYH